MAAFLVATLLQIDLLKGDPGFISNNGTVDKNRRTQWITPSQTNANLNLFISYVKKEENNFNLIDK